MDQEETEIKLFQPSEETGKFLKQQYPELNEFEEFRVLRDYELKFVWYFANPTSPVSGTSDKIERAMYSVEYAFGEGISESERRKYLSCKFNDKLKGAIKVMSGFIPDYRLRAKISVEHVFKNIEAILHLDEDKRMMMDVGKMKQYSEMAMKIVSELPGMISIMERGFGIVEMPKKKKEEKRIKEEPILSMEDKIKGLDQIQN